MNKIWTIVTGLIAMGSVMASDIADVSKNLAAQATPHTITVQGKDGWLYSKNELLHLAKGELAGGKVIAASACAKKANADPQAALVDFNNRLKALGIRLIVLPVPPKAAFYPPAGLKAGDAMKYLKPYYAELHAAGIETVDLSDLFLKNLPAGVYCKTDAHWSPAGIALAVDALQEKIALKGKEPYKTAVSMTAISGDLAKSLSPGSPATEELALQVVSGNVFDDASPILVIGDSHTLIFSTGGDMLAENAGFCEQLAAALHMPVERIGVKGSAATAVRINLYRKAARNPGWLKNKKVIIYCFSSREFTEAASGWSKVPVQKQ